MRLLLLFAFVGCVTPGQDQVRIGDIQRDCVVPVPDGTRALGAPVSIEYPDGSLWIWDSLDHVDGSTVANASARMRSVNDNCARPPTLAMDAFGYPRSLLALTKEEIVSNVTRDDHRELALVPTGGFSHEGVGYLYYDHVLRGPGEFDAEMLGTGLCVIEPKATECERIHAGDTSILWKPDDRVMNRGGFVEGAHAILAGCRPTGPFHEKCTVSRVHLDSIREPWAYEVYNDTRGWVDSLVDASEVTDSVGSLTLARMSDRFVAVELDVYASEVSVRFSAHAEKDFGPRRHAFDVLAQPDWFVSGGREHSSLRTDSRSIVVSYATANPEAPGLHFVDFRLHDE